MIDKEICFKIDSKELFLEQILVEYENTPVYFICVDTEQEYYIVLYPDIYKEQYIIVKTDIAKIVKLLKQKLTMRDLIICADTYYQVIIGETIEYDQYVKYDIRSICLNDLPYQNSYFQVVTKEHKEFLDRLEISLNVNERRKA